MPRIKWKYKKVKTKLRDFIKENLFTIYNYFFLRIQNS